MASVTNFSVAFALLGIATLAEANLRGSSGDLPSFASFITMHKRTYSKGSEEYDLRHGIYKNRLREVQQHNRNPGRLWNAGINHLSDRTNAELARLRGLRAVKSKRSSGEVAPHGAFLGQVQSVVLPENKSYTNLHSVMEGVDQESCGSCWAVATATVLRANAEYSGYDRDFSAQELVSCTPNPHKCGGNGGCGGSTIELAMNWVMESGIATSAETPYLGTDGTCKKSAPLMQMGSLTQGSGDTDLDHDEKFQQMTAVGFHGPASSSSPGVALHLEGWTRLGENEYEPLLQALATTGPVASSVAAGAWSSYSDGIFDSCSKDAIIDHAVSTVGYGKEGNKKYWIIKNSWGGSWGENGNIRLLRTDNEATYCGTDDQPDVGTGCEGGPSEVRVCGMCGILYDNVAVHFKKQM